MENLNVKKIAKYALACSSGLFLLVTIFGSFYTVDEGHVGVVKRFGEATDMVMPGLHFKLPITDDVVEMEVRTRKNVEKLAASTNEQMPVGAEVSINWTVITDQAFDLYKKYGGLSQFESRILDPKLRSAAKEAIAQYKAEEIIQNRGAVIGKIEELLMKGMKDYPVKLDSAQLENVSLPERYIQSIETKQTEKNLADAENHKLARQKLEAQQKVNTAESERDAKKATADGNAYSILKEAGAEAKSIRLKGLAEAASIMAKSNALKRSKTLVEYTRAKQWDGKMPKTMMGSGQSILWNMNKSK